MLHYRPCKSNQTFSLKADVNSVSFIHNRGESLSRCSQCKTSRYCSVQCQVRALHTRHQRAYDEVLFQWKDYIQFIHIRVCT